MAQKKPPLLSRTLVVLLFSMILANIGGAMYGPLLPLYVQQLGADVSQVGLFFTLSMIAPLLFQILGGWISDSIGRVRAMALGSLAGLVGYVLFVVSPSWGWLLLAMVGISMASSFVGPSFQALIAEESAEHNRGKVYGITQGAFQVVGVIGAPLGGLIADKYGFRVMFMVACGLYFLATLLRLLMARKIRQDVKAPSAAAPSFAGLKTSLLSIVAMLTAGGVITWIFISDGIGDFSSTTINNLVPLYINNLMGMSKTQLGIMGAVASIATMAFITLAGALSDKRGERVGIVLGYFLLAASILVMISVRTFYGFIFAWFLLGVGQAMIGPAYSSLISKVVPEKLRGTFFGLFSTSLGVISLPAPYIGAMLWEKFSPRTPFFVPVVALFIIIPIIWFKFKLPTNTGTPGPTQPDDPPVTSLPVPAPADIPSK